MTRPRKVRPKHGWTEDRVRAELRDFLAGRDEWPTYAEFARTGQRSLRDAVTHTGGAERWARRMRVRYVKRKPGYAPRWTEDRIRSELREFVAGLEAFPTRIEFEQAARKHLRDAVARTGGPERWAREFDLPLPARHAGIRRGWTDERIETELKRFVGRRRRWPRRADFVSAGQERLLQAAYHWHGAEYWARRLGLEYVPRAAAAKPRRWTDETIRAGLIEFCGNRERWPSEREFTEAGLRPLYVAASRHGGVARWADELGLRRGRRV